MPRSILRALFLSALVLPIALAGFASARAQPGLPAGTWRSFACGDCPVTIALAPDAVWAGTVSAGLIRYDRASGATSQFNRANGLGGNAIWDIAVAPDGHVWAATGLMSSIGPRTGVSHWDGRRWENHDSSTGLPDNVVKEVAAGPGGTAWVVSNGQLVRFDGRSWRVHGQAEGLPGTTVASVSVGADNTAWAATDAGLARFDGARWAPLPNTGLPSPTLNTIGAAEDGTVWAQLEGRQVAQFHPTGWPGGASWQVSPPAGLPERIGAPLMSLDPRGGVWLLDGENAAHFDGARWAVTPLGAEASVAWSTGLAADRDGTLWLASPSHGLWQRRDGRWSRRSSGFGISNLAASTLAIDARDRPWVGMYGLTNPDNMVNVLEGDRWLPQGQAEGMLLSSASPLGLTSNGIDADELGNTWVGVEALGLARHDGRSWSTQIFTDVLGIAPGVRYVRADGRGGAWLATSAGALHFDGRDRWRRLTVADGLASDDVRSMAVDRRSGSEVLWFATAAGVSRWDGQRWQTFTARDGLPDHPISEIMVDRGRDRIWFGSRGPNADSNGLTYFDGRRWTNLTGADGLPDHDGVWGMALAPNGDLWVAWAQDGSDYYGPGISRYDGQSWTQVTARDGLSIGIVFDIAVDRAGQVWVATLAGVDRFTPATVPGPQLTVTPSPTPVPEPGPCVCRIARERAPQSQIDAALANPAAIAGWQQPLDPNKPPGPFNPLRSCLSIQRPAVPPHPVFNPLFWRAGCP